MFVDPLAGPRYGEGINAMLWWDDASGPTLYAAGHIKQVGSKKAQGFMRWDGTRWIPLGMGPQGATTTSAFSSIRDLVEHKGQLLAVGWSMFDASNREIRSIARWTGKHWEQLPNTELQDGDRVLEIQVDGERLLAHGYFSFFGGAPSSGTALWNGSAWRHPGTESNFAPGSPMLLNGELIACSYGFVAPETPAWVRWTGNTWVEMGGGPVDLCWDNTQFVIGDSMFVFDRYGVIEPMRWNGQWHAVVPPGDGVAAMVPHGAGAVASLITRTSSGPDRKSIGWYDGNSWQPFPSQRAAGATRMSVYDDELFFFGDWFDRRDDSGIGPSMLVNWSPNGGLTNWDYLSPEGYSVAKFEGGLVMGSGQKHAIGKTFGCIAMWQDNEWSTLGQGIPSCEEDEGGVDRLAVHEGMLYALVNFNVNAHRPPELWRWEGSAWQRLNLPSGEASELVSTPMGLVYAGQGGIFLRSGQQWQRLGQEVNPVGEVVWLEDQLYALVSFPGFAWSPVLARLVEGAWVASGPIQFYPVSAVAHDGKLLVIGKPSSTPSPRWTLMQLGESGWDSVREFNNLNALHTWMSSTEVGLVVAADPVLLIDGDKTVELRGCKSAFKAHSFMGDLFIVGFDERYGNSPCVFGQTLDTEVEIWIEPLRPQPGQALTASVLVRSEVSAPQGMVGVDGTPAGSCTVFDLTPINATESIGSCELGFNRDVDVELVANYFGSARSGGDGWHNSWSAPVQVSVSAGIFTDSFE